MLKIVLTLSLIALSMQHHYKHNTICRELEDIKCKHSVGCFFDPATNVCQTSEYELLGHRRDTFSQYIVFDGDVTCDNILNVSDFVATQTFKNSKPFRSFCNMNGIKKVQVDGTLYDEKTAEDFVGKTGTGAIIYPKVEEGCILAFTKRNYRGTSWRICRPTKLNGQKVRSIMPGDHVMFSLFDREGYGYPAYQMVTGNDAPIADLGFPEIKNKHVEYIKIQFVFDD